MSEITIAFREDDIDFIEILKSNFGDDVLIFESDGFLGSEFLFVAIIPITAVTVQLIDFFMTHFTTKKNEKQNTKVVMKSKGNYISLSGYSREDVVEFLQSIKGEEK